MIEYPTMNRGYFDNVENVRADLKAFASELGDGKTVRDLRTRSLRNKLVKCSNDEKISWATYLSRAGIQMGMAADFSKVQSMHLAVLTILKKKIGIKIIENPKMDKAYFENIDNLRTDLEAYATELGKGKGVEDLRAGNIRTLKVKCCNGEEVAGHTYINRAGVALGLADGTRKATSKQAEILKFLVEIVD